MNWLISAQGKIYNHAAAFRKWGFIDWRQGRIKYTVGDIVYIYCAKPVKKLIYKAIVERINMTKSDIVNDEEFWHDKSEYYGALGGRFTRLKLIEQVDKDELKYEFLLQHGLNRAPQGPIRMPDELKLYVDKYMTDVYDYSTFQESDSSEDYIEGVKLSVVVNQYERSSYARKKCIEYKGCYCHICGMDFEKVYGELGKGFIHIHHINPLSHIKNEHVVNYKEDLLPVCPNCHAMLHRKIENKCCSVEELKDIIKRNI